MVFINPSSDEEKPIENTNKEPENNVDVPNIVDDSNRLVAPKVLNNMERDIFGNAIKKEVEEEPELPVMNENRDGNALFAPEIENEKKDIFGIPGLGPQSVTPTIEEEKPPVEEKKEEVVEEEKNAPITKLEEENVLDKMMASNNNGKYKLTLNRKKNFVGCLVAFVIYIDGEKVGKIKNGKTLVLEVTGGKHTISIHKNNQVDIVIDRDTTADVVVYGANNFGITNINGGEGNEVEEERQRVNYLSKTQTSTNLTLIASILLPIISVVLLLTIQFYIQFYIHGVTAGIALVNLAGLKNLKGTKEHKSLLIKNIISVVISFVAGILMAVFVNY